jgi:hypothetical protein
MAIAVPPLTQDPFVIAAGAVGPCEVPIRTIATSVSELRFPAFRPQFSADTYFYNNALQQSS